jgi:glycine cleavage system H protein
VIAMSTHYTKDHEWARLEGDVVTCGISNHAAVQLGGVVYIELPAIGRIVKAGESMAVVESAKAASDVYAPVSGEVVAVNEALTTAPETVDAGPEAQGWFVKLKPTNIADLDSLLNAGDYAVFVKG